MEDPIRSAIARAFRVDYADVNEESTADTVKGWDSFGLLQLAQLLEEEFDIELEPEDYAELVSVASVRSVVEKKSG